MWIMARARWAVSPLRYGAFLWGALSSQLHGGLTLIHTEGPSATSALGESSCGCSCALADLPDDGAAGALSCTFLFPRLLVFFVLCGKRESWDGGLSTKTGPLVASWNPPPPVLLWYRCVSLLLNSLRERKSEPEINVFGSHIGAQCGALPVIWHFLGVWIGHTQHNSTLLEAKLSVQADLGWLGQRLCIGWQHKLLRMTFFYIYIVSCTRHCLCVHLALGFTHFGGRTTNFRSWRRDLPLHMSTNTPPCLFTYK